MCNDIISKNKASGGYMVFTKAIPIWKKGAVCPDDYAEFRLSFAGRYDEAFILIAAGTDYTARLNGALTHIRSSI